MKVSAKGIELIKSYEGCNHAHVFPCFMFETALLDDPTSLAVSATPVPLSKCRLIFKTVSSLYTFFGFLTPFLLCGIFSFVSYACLLFSPYDDHSKFSILLSVLIPFLWLIVFYFL